MDGLSLFLFGPPRIMRDGAPIALGARKAVALLAYLAKTRKNVGRETLAALLYPESNESRAKANLRQTLGRTRSALGAENLGSDRGSVWISAESHLWVDTCIFRDLLEAAIRQYDRCKIMRADGLGEAPGRETERFHAEAEALVSQCPGVVGSRRLQIASRVYPSLAGNPIFGNGSTSRRPELC
jgi:hypothetical protein